MFAETAFERKSSAVFEPDRIRDLTLERADLLRLIRGRCRGDAVLLRVKTETFSEVHSIRTGHGGTETFDGREYLLVEVPFDVRLQGGGGIRHLCRGISTFGDGVMGCGGP